MILFLLFYIHIHLNNDNNLNNAVFKLQFQLMLGINFELLIHTIDSLKRMEVSLFLYQVFISLCDKLTF